MFPQAREELEKWGLRLNPQMVQLEGRTLNPEKIMFKSNAVSAGVEADWGRQVVKEHVISAVRHYAVCVSIWYHPVLCFASV